MNKEISSSRGQCLLLKDLYPSVFSYLTPSEIIFVSSVSKDFKKTAEKDKSVIALKSLSKMRKDVNKKLKESLFKHYCPIYAVFLTKLVIFSSLWIVVLKIYEFIVDKFNLNWSEEKYKLLASQNHGFAMNWSGLIALISFLAVNLFLVKKIIENHEQLTFSKWYFKEQSRSRRSKAQNIYILILEEMLNTKPRRKQVNKLKHLSSEVLKGDFCGEGVNH